MLHRECIKLCYPDVQRCFAELTQPHVATTMLSTGCVTHAYAHAQVRSITFALPLGVAIGQCCRIITNYALCIWMFLYAGLAIQSCFCYIAIHSISDSKCTALIHAARPCALQDVVTREGKLLFLYKRPGQRVIVDASGRLIVRPSHIEAHVQRDTAGASLHATNIDMCLTKFSCTTGWRVGNFCCWSGRALL